MKDNRKTHVHNHFIQKAFAKNFSVNDIIKWKKYKGEESGSFSISKKKQPIASDYFYSKEVEIGMNNLERKWSKISYKMIQQSFLGEEIQINREEVITIKLYTLLSSVRTKKIRENIKTRNGDSMFNEFMEKLSLDEQTIQELIIKEVIKYDNNHDYLYNQLRKTMEYIFNGINSVEDFVSVTYNQTHQSRMNFLRFEGNNLMLSESQNFTEQNRETGGILLSFFPIAPFFGICFYFDPILTRGVDSRPKSEIFTKDVHTSNNVVNFKFRDEIKRYMQENVDKKNSNHEQIHLNILQAVAINKFKANGDTYTYNILNEGISTSDICNAMSLIHNKGHVVVYQKEEDFMKAEKIISEKDIFRIEDYT